MNDEEGQDRANDYLDDDFFKGEWKYAVEQDHTEKSYEDFKQEYVDNHDWLEILGDIKDITINGDTYYTQLTSCGCLMEYTFKDMTKTQLTKDEIETIANADKLLHLKPISEISGHTPLENLLKQVTEIFMKYNIEDWDLEVGKFTDKWEELENNGEIEN
ncbi:hypothetical protein [Serratia sp. (in: enterobacteria)]|uniref:hypothetical protein n=1 Tax=Serratia sp. (in: enterobacteria) TaxID=616 RepID=UPI003989ABBB